MKKAMTLVELLISGSIFLIIVFAAWAYHKSSSEFYQSSEYKSHLVAELNLAIGHMDKTLAKVTGKASGNGVYDHKVYINPTAKIIGFHIDDPALVTPDNFADDINMRYAYNATNHSLDFCDDWDSTSTPPTCVGTTEVLVSQQLSNMTVVPMVTQGIEYGVKVILKGRHRPAKQRHMHNNPEAELESSFFFGEYSLS